MATFGEVTATGEIRPIALSTRIGRSLFNTPDSEYGAADFGPDVDISRRNIGVIIENQQAKNLADDINAQPVVYGTVEVVDNIVTGTPRFFVSGYADAEELTGRHELAMPIRFDLEEAESTNIDEQIEAWVAILLLFTQGLVFLSGGDRYGASDSFEQAIAGADRRQREQGAPFDSQEVGAGRGPYTEIKYAELEKLPTRHATMRQGIMRRLRAISVRSSHSSVNNLN